MADDGTRPSATADKQLGEIVSDVTQKAQLLVREEIALAKAEIQVKTSRIVKGIAAFAAAGFFALMLLVFLLHTAAWGINDWLNSVWKGYAFTSAGLLLLTIVAALIGLRMLKKGAPPTPDYAIEEAQATKRALDEVRS